MSSENLVRKLFAKHGFNFFENGTLNLNFFGVRSTKRTDAFDDAICLVFKDDNGWVTKAFPATTDAGAAVLGQKSDNPAGTAILPSSTVSGRQYKFRLGAHKGQYPALNQAEDFIIVRDGNKDGKLLTRSEIATLLKNNKFFKGLFGINTHHANDKMLSQKVGDWSHGCQVIQSISDWGVFWAIISRSAIKYGPLVTYTLFDEEDLDGMDVASFIKVMNS